MKKNILVIDDSALMRRVLSDSINSDPRFIVKDVAVNGEEGLKMLLETPTLYDAVLLDIYMPKMTGLELLVELEKHKEVKPKVVICSTRADESATETLTALEHGAFDFIKKPVNLVQARGNMFREHLLEILDVATQARTPVIPKRPEVRPVLSASKSSALTAPPLAEKLVFSKGTGTKLIALACSTGGPKTLQSVIPYLPKELDAPMVLVQHMPAGFTSSLADRLNEISKVHVKEAEDGELLEKGTVYIAPGGKHLKVAGAQGAPRIIVSDEPPRDALKPCANLMYESLVDSRFDEIVCVVLTGMGADGTEGIKALKAKKKVYVIAQDEATCVVYGMPKMVARARLTDEVLPVTEIANTITKKVGVQ